MNPATKKKSIFKRIILPIIGGLVVLFVLLNVGMLWWASDQLLSPVWKGVEKDLSVCKPETTKAFGEGCGNLRTTHQFVFSEVKIRSNDAYDLPGWLIKAEENGMEPAQGVIMLAHSGGSDRREETKFIKFFLNQRLDVLMFDFPCHGEAPCPTHGLTYGDRESKDVLSVYNYLTDKYEKVYALGTSVGASAILIALPEMPKLAGVISDSSMANFPRLIKEAPESQSGPGFFVDGMIKLAMLRGNFDGHPNPEESLRLAKTTPILFIHSKGDKVVSYKHSQDLANIYAGPKTVWFPEKGSHVGSWDADPAAYEEQVANFLKSIE